MNAGAGEQKGETDAQALVTMYGIKSPDLQ